MNISVKCISEQIFNEIVEKPRLIKKQRRLNEIFQKEIILISYLKDFISYKYVYL